MKAKWWLVCILLIWAQSTAAAQADWQTPTLGTHLVPLPNDTDGSIRWYCPTAEDYLIERFTYNERIDGPDGLVKTYVDGIYERNIDFHSADFRNDACTVNFAEVVNQPGQYALTVQYSKAYEVNRIGPVDDMGGFTYCGLNVSVRPTDGAARGTATVSSLYARSAVRDAEGYDLLDVQGHTATLTAMPDDGYYFVGWVKDGQWIDNCDATIIVTLTDLLTNYEAVFAKIPARVVTAVSASFDAPPSGPLDSAGLNHRFTVDSGAYTEKYPYQEPVYFVNTDGSVYTGNYVDGQTLIMKVHLSVMTGYQRDTVYATYDPNYRGAANVPLTLTMNGQTATYQSLTNEGDNLNVYYEIPVMIHSACHVTFDLNGRESTAPTAQTVVYGETAKRPANPTASGYQFTGWFTDAACRNKYSFSSPVTGDLTLYAGWSALVDRVDIWTEGPIQNAQAGSIQVHCPTDQVRFQQYSWYIVSGDTSTRMADSEQFMSGKTYALKGLLQAQGVTLTSNTKVYVNGVQAATATAMSGYLNINAAMPCTPEASVQLVTFNMNGYGSQIVPQRIQHGGTAWEPPTPTDSRARFNGYSTTMQDGHTPTNIPYAFDAPVTENTAIDLNWSVYARSVTLAIFPPDAGEPASSARFDVLSGGVTLSPEIRWQDSNGSFLSDEETFRAGETYYFDLTLSPKRGYIFDTAAPAVTINNANVESVTMGADGSVTVSGSVTVQDMITITFDANGHGDAPAPIRYPYGTSLFDMEIPVITVDDALFFDWYLAPECGDDDHYARLANTEENDAVTRDAIFYAKWMEVDDTVSLSVYMPAPQPGPNVYSRAEAYIGGGIAQSEGGRQNDAYRVGCDQYWYTAPNLNEANRVYDNLIVGNTYYAYVSIDQVAGKVFPETFTARVNGHDVIFTRDSALTSASGWYEFVMTDRVVITFDLGREDVTAPESIMIAADTTFGEAFDIRFGGQPEAGCSLGQWNDGWLLDRRRVRMEDTPTTDITLTAHWADIVTSAELTIEIPEPGDAVTQPAITQPESQQAFEGFGTVWLNMDGTAASGVFQPGETYICRVTAYVWTDKVFDNGAWITVNGETIYFTGDRTQVSADIPVTIPRYVTITFDPAKNGVAAPEPMTVPERTILAEAFGEGGLSAMTAPDGQIMAWWLCDGEPVDLSAPLMENVTLRPLWVTPIDGISIIMPIPAAGEMMTPQVRCADDPRWHIRGAYFDMDDECLPDVFAAGDTVTLRLSFDAAEGYGFAPMGGDPITRITVNGLPTEIQLSTVKPPCVASISIAFTFTVDQPGGTLSLPMSLKEIGEEAFAGTDTWRVIIPEGVTTIGPRAFAGCSNLHRVTIPATTTEIDDSAFDGCPANLMIETSSAVVRAWAEDRGIVVSHELAG